MRSGGVDRRSTDRRSASGSSAGRADPGDAVAVDRRPSLARSPSGRRTGSTRPPSMRTARPLMSTTSPVRRHEREVRRRRSGRRAQTDLLVGVVELVAAGPEPGGAVGDVAHDGGAPWLVGDVGAGRVPGEGVVQRRLAGLQLDRVDAEPGVGRIGDRRARPLVAGRGSTTAPVPNTAGRRSPSRWLPAAMRIAAVVDA